MALDDILQAITDECVAGPIRDRRRILDAMYDLVLELKLADEAAAAPRAASAQPAAAASLRPAAQPVLPAKTPQTGQGRDGLGRQTQHVLAVLRVGDAAWTDGWVATGLLAAKAGMTHAALKGHLQHLGARGLVETRGKTSARRYRASRPDSERSGSRPVAAARPDPPVQAPVEQPATAVEMRVARSRILDHLSRRKLSEQSLVGTLNLKAELIAEICARLLAEGKIVRLPNGTYTHADASG